MARVQAAAGYPVSAIARRGPRDGRPCAGRMLSVQGSHDQHRGLEKIRSQALRRELLSGDDHPVIVVVEIDLPPAPMEAVSSGGSGLHLSGYRFLDRDHDAETVRRRVSEAREGIESVTGKPPETYLAAAGSFVVEASGDQILHIAELPSVAAIWANTGV